MNDSKGKSIKKLGKGTVAIVILIAVALVAGGAVYSYYATITTTGDVLTSISIDGEVPEATITGTPFTAYGGGSNFDKHKVENNAPDDIMVCFDTAITGSAHPNTVGAYVYHYLAELQTKNSATATWSGNDAHLTTTGTVGDGDEARIHIDMPTGTTLADILEISWKEYTVSGYAPHVDIILDTTGDGIKDDALVIEYAYNGDEHKVVGWPAYGTEYGAWYDTFNDDGNGPSAIDDSAYAWLTSGPAGDVNIVAGTLAEWKAGTIIDTWKPTEAPTVTIVNGDSIVLAIEIEVDNWISGGSAVNTEAYVKDIHIKATVNELSLCKNIPAGELFGLYIASYFDPLYTPDSVTLVTTISSP